MIRTEWVDQVIEAGHADKKWRFVRPPEKAPVDAIWWAVFEENGVQMIFGAGYESGRFLTWPPRRNGFQPGNPPLEEVAVEDVDCGF